MREKRGYYYKWDEDWVAKVLARDAVRIDGWMHFLTTYNEKFYETEDGLVYFRR